ncbi:MAG: hypothetical protein C5B59_15615 [Bacteroidetes bacterium]|nr:MAG: hypothetical protein C5B59_15615 [Bacteroidota bacterium]
MPYSESLANKVRECLSEVKKVDEKKMFSGICFMVNDKMCICVGNKELMCRVGPHEYEKALEKKGCRPMIHNGKPMKGFVFVHEEAVKTQKNLQYWVDACLNFNKDAKSSKAPAKKKKSKPSRL